MERKRLKLRPHYGWIGGVFVVGALAVGVAMTGIETTPVDAAEKTIADITTMQEMTPEICAKMAVTPTGTTAPDIKLTDARDGSTYSIAKFADGNCWMTQNLRIINKTISGADSDLPSGSTFTIPAGSSKDNFKSANKLTEQVYVSTSSETPANITYYNWYTATASSGDGRVETDGTVVSSSICPKGWELPTGGSGGQFQGLATTIGDTKANTWRGNPYNFAATGDVGDGSLYDTSNGYYWSRTTRSADSAYYLYVDSSTVYPANNYNRFDGIAVRCVAANALEVAIDEANVTTMQDFGAGVCAKGNDGDTAYLTDARDGKTYSIAKIKNATNDDANCWMTSNLAFDLREGGVASGAAVVLDPSTSDVTRKWPDADSSVVAEEAEATLVNNGGFDESTPYDNIQYSNNGTGSGNYKPEYGYYYSWCAATANSCGYSTDDDGTDGKRSASQSICPKGWKLPTGGSGGEYQALLGTSSWDTVKAGTKYNFYPAGYIYYRGADYIGSYAYYWSSTSKSDTLAYSFGYSGTMPQANSDVRYYGNSVRCVADPAYTGSSSGSNQKDSASASFSIEVKDAITVSNVSFTDAEGREVVLSAMPGELVNGKINVNVGSNVKYRITMSSAAPDLASSDSDNTNKIPAITQPMTAEQLKSNYGWGVLAKNSDNQTDATTYTGLDATNKTFYTSPTPAGASTETRFNVGVSVPPTLPADTYSTEVTVTAIATE